ncbi:MAG: hypothetical protein KKH98_10065 [Spirochaetes bacterium]|nr:hypothetical protein [Spirochaetota bacterium]
MASLKKILNLLKANYRKVMVSVPCAWYYPEMDFSGKTKTVNIYDFFINFFQDRLLKPQQYKLCIDLKRSIIYSALIRTTTAYDFDKDNRLSLKDKFGLRETGTILRMFLLIPFLKKIGVNILYLLPITQSSDRFKKGEATTPYSVSNLFKIDPLLYDPMLGPYSDQKLEDLFSALVEVCHKFGIRVVLDYIPRTAARDSALIKEHPNWFYWIDKQHEKGFRPPFIEGVSTVTFEKKYTRKVYRSPDTGDYLKKFTESPEKIDHGKWKRLLSKADKGGSSDILQLVEKEFKITTVPGFSDVINDPQPLWSEVTFLKMYMDPPFTSQKYILSPQAPYVLFDIIKTSRAPGKVPNKKLWNLLSSVLPFWQKKYKIDGARIDMAHALPPKLEKQIITKARKKNRNFFLIAEEMNCRNSAFSLQAGYSAIAGDLFITEPRWKKGELKKSICNVLPALSLPIMAASETHDTPRAISRQGKKRYYYFTVVLNYFLPHTIPFINSGFELQELQPMNMGIDSEFSDIYGLPKKDLNYGKMALFDYTSLHWNNDNRKVIRLMEYCSQLHLKYPELKKWKNFKFIKLKHRYITGFTSPVGNGELFVLINTDVRRGYRVRFSVNTNMSKDQMQGILSSHLYYKKNLFFNPDIFKRIRPKNKILKVRMKSAEILMLYMGDERRLI